MSGAFLELSNEEKPNQWRPSLFHRLLGTATAPHMLKIAIGSSLYWHTGTRMALLEAHILASVCTLTRSCVIK